MSETIEQETARSLPLDEKHRQSGAVLEEREGWLVPASYGESEAEYACVREGGAGLVDLSLRGRISVYGSEAVMFLNGLMTNDVKTLAEGSWMPAVFPNVQGRLLASARVIHEGKRFLIDTESVTRAQVFKLLERFNLAGDFRALDITEETAQLSLQGARSTEVLGLVLDRKDSLPERQEVFSTSWRGVDLALIRATHTGEDGFDLFIEASGAQSLWEALVAAGAHPFGQDALEVMRLEAGVPRFKVDMDETTVVLETGLEEAVSFTKGCYIGQEIIARIHWRGHVAKKLTGLSFENRTEVPREARIGTLDGKEIGRVTSSTFSPRLNRTIALGYVKYDYLAPGTELRVLFGDEEQSVHVTALPFVRGSWHASSSELKRADEQAG
ncbi:MAG TPA: aminomethyltransferase family protein [Pyrinomonadaceae bacterium]|jgi:folate-binding protein YgfZ